MSDSTRRPARILIVDDHPIVRHGLRQMFASTPDLSVCGEAGTAEAALVLARTSAAHLAIVDLSLGAGGGLQLIADLRATAPAMAILVLSIHDESLFAERALRAGARGYITKQEAIDGLVRAVRHVLDGHIYLSDQASQRILEGLRANLPGDDRLSGLTNRELQVFELIGTGLTTKAIAAEMGVSVKTIETYRSNIKSKLQLPDATALIRYATSWVERV
jgi:DNA-binding NarL/FixJ family response regulator